MPQKENIDCIHLCFTYEQQPDMIDGKGRDPGDDQLIDDQPGRGFPAPKLLPGGVDGGHAGRIETA